MLAFLFSKEQCALGMHGLLMKKRVKIEEMLFQSSATIPRQKQQVTVAEIDSTVTTNCAEQQPPEFWQVLCGRVKVVKAKTDDTGRVKLDRTNWLFPWFYSTALALHSKHKMKQLTSILYIKVVHIS